MPIDFENANDIRRIQRLFQFPTGWATSVRRIINNALTRIGSSALLDTGTAGGEVPLVAAERGIGDVVADATTERKGFIRQTNDVPLAADVNDALRGVDIGSRNINTRTPTTRFIRQGAGGLSDFGNPVQTNIYRMITSSNPALFLYATPGQPGASRFNQVHADGLRLGELDIGNVVLLSDSNDNDATSRIYLNGGGAETVRDPEGNLLANLPLLQNRSNTDIDNERQSLYYLTQAQLDAFGFQWGVVIKGWGGEGHHRRALRDISSGPAVQVINNRMRTAGVDGDLLIAFHRGLASVYFDDERPILEVQTLDGQTGYTAEILL